MYIYICIYSNIPVIPLCFHNMLGFCSYPHSPRRCFSPHLQHAPETQALFHEFAQRPLEKEAYDTTWGRKNRQTTMVVNLDLWVYYR